MSNLLFDLYPRRRSLSPDGKSPNVAALRRNGIFGLLLVLLGLALFQPIRMMGMAIDIQGYGYDINTGTWDRDAATVHFRVRLADDQAPDGDYQVAFTETSAGGGIYVFAAIFSVVYGQVIQDNSTASYPGPTGSS